MESSLDACVTVESRGSVSACVTKSLLRCVHSVHHSAVSAEISRAWMPDSVSHGLVETLRASTSPVRTIYPACRNVLVGYLSDYQPSYFYLPLLSVDLSAHSLLCTRCLSLLITRSHMAGQPGYWLVKIFCRPRQQRCYGFDCGRCRQRFGRGRPQRAKGRAGTRGK